MLLWNRGSGPSALKKLHRCLHGPRGRMPTRQASNRRTCMTSSRGKLDANPDCNRIKRSSTANSRTVHQPGKQCIGYCSTSAILAGLADRCDSFFMGMKTVGVVMTKLIELFMDYAVHGPRGEAPLHKGSKQKSMHDVVPVGDPTKAQSVIMIQKMQTTGGPRESRCCRQSGSSGVAARRPMWRVPLNKQLNSPASWKERQARDTAVKTTESKGRRFDPELHRRLAMSVYMCCRSMKKYPILVGACSMCNR